MENACVEVSLDMVVGVAELVPSWCGGWIFDTYDLGKKKLNGKMVPRNK